MLQRHTSVHALFIEIAGTRTHIVFCTLTTNTYVCYTTENFFSVRYDFVVIVLVWRYFFSSVLRMLIRNAFVPVACLARANFSD